MGMVGRVPKKKKKINVHPPHPPSSLFFFTSHLVGHIKDLGHDPSLPTTRLYATAAAQPWHNDSADLVSLLALSPAARGGLSRWASSIAIYNELLATRPDDAAVLAARGAWYYDRKGEVPAGKDPYFEMPILNFSRGYLSVNISANYYR